MCIRDRIEIDSNLNDSNVSVVWSVLECNDTSSIDCPEFNDSCWSLLSNNASHIFDAAGSYRLRLICDGGSFIDYYFNIFEGALSTNDDILKELRIYPNPVDNFINIPTTLIGLDYNIYSVLGAEVSEGKFYADKLDLSFLSEGVYFLNAKGHEIIKIIKK